MATHDYVIANQSGAAFRTDLNNALAAIVSNNSNSSEPATKYAYQWWADTSAGVLKIRNSANNAWIELLQLDGTLTLEDGSASTPALAFRDDLNTGIFSSAADTFDIATGGSNRFQIDSSGRIGINETSQGSFNSLTDMFVISRSSGHCGITIRSGTSNQGNVAFADGANTLIRGAVRYDHSGDDMHLITNGSIQFTIDNSGQVGIGTTSPNERLVVSGNASVTGALFITSNTSTPTAGAFLYRPADNTLALGSNSGERMRMDSSGRVLIGTIDANSVSARLVSATGSVPAYYANPSGLSVTTGNNADANCVEFFQGRYNKRVLTLSHSYNQSVSLAVFEQADVSVGSITGDGSNVSFNESSDYRLKENIVNITDGITRLKQLIPRRFNWIADSTNTLRDGFLAHEVSPIIPEAVTGEKDALEEDGSIDPQQMDYGKLTPLLTAALQEAIAKIEVLETKVAALEAS
jgi:hypothetical protein